MEKYKIIANPNQLDAEGISAPINGLTGELVKKFPTGYYVIKVKYPGAMGEYTDNFDIPKYLLEKIDNGN